MATAAAAPKKQVMHIVSVPKELVAHPSVFVCLPPNVFNPNQDYGQSVTSFFHPHAALQSGTTYKCPHCNSVYSSQ